MANCSWPVFLTLAACGECTPVPVYTSCNQTARTCRNSTSPTNVVETPIDAEGYRRFTVSPSNGTVHAIASTNQSCFSVFELVSVSRTDGEDPMASGNECALWFCVQAYSVSVGGGMHNETLAGSSVATTLKRGSHGVEHVFVDISDGPNVENGTRFTVTHQAMTALRWFMVGVTSGTVHADVGTISSSSDWVEAM